MIADYSRALASLGNMYAILIVVTANKLTSHFMHTHTHTHTHTHITYWDIEIFQTLLPPLNNRSLAVSGQW